jgi:spectinomycin phosphotransferase
LDVVQIAFLPLGADKNTAVCRASADDTTDYFVKSRLGDFDEASVALPKFLSDQGVAQVMAPLETEAGRLWTNPESFRLILYPFIEGRNSYEPSLSDDHWVEFGATLKRIHTAFALPSLIRLIQREAYSPQWRDAVTTFLETSETGARDDVVSVKLRGHIVFAAV